MRYDNSTLTANAVLQLKATQTPAFVLQHSMKSIAMKNSFLFLQKLFLTFATSAFTIQEIKFLH